MRRRIEKRDNIAMWNFGLKFIAVELPSDIFRVAAGRGFSCGRGVKVRTSESSSGFGAWDRSCLAFHTKDFQWQ